MTFMQRHYTGGNLVLAAAGNVDHASLVEQTRDSFWSMSAEEPSGAVQISPNVQLGTLVAETRDTGHVYFSMAWPAPAYTDPDRYAWHVFATLFGGGPNSRLYRTLRETHGLVYHIAAEYQAYGSTGALVVEGSALPEALVPVLAGILIELFKLGEETINADDLHRVKQSLISQHLISGDSRVCAHESSCAPGSIFPASDFQRRGHHRIARPIAGIDPTGVQYRVFKWHSNHRAGWPY